MSNTKPLRNWSLTLLAIASLGYGLYYFKSSEITAQSSQAMPEYPEPVDVAAALLLDYKDQVTVPAEVVAPDAIVLTNELAGTVRALNLKNGSLVTKGELLLQLDISEETASLNTAKARAKLASTELKRTQSLQKRQLVAAEALDRAEAEFEINLAEVARIEAIIAKKTVYAPFDGILGLHDLSVGEYLAPNSQITSLVAAQTHLWIDVSLSQQQSQNLTDDQVELVLPSVQGSGVFAKIIAKNPLIDKQTRSVKYRAVLKQSADVSLTPGAFIEVNVKQGEAISMIRLPKQAILRQQASRYVYVLQPESEGLYRVQRRDIDLFQENGEYSYIEGGLTAGEQVVTAGAFKLYPNKLVNIRQVAKNAASANAASDKE
ncbi:efflux RND transporter periplasmic adaptor subunit [Shewanella sp. SR44-3]|uniref:efflux RND transporter periplasmic adaptor subunit n=1 Tax=Shewanella sp. SR44-3 TaxID=2760936 RepID=UPI0015FDB450|nr:efflux RND transporter periplasmic adaptor subunit [Shewanella sp. SR44-3]MBB1270864.1 efflux RND transporter periplasmic adaptor subunit [Shewanella sp. SR44-3]